MLPGSLHSVARPMKAVGAGTLAGMFCRVATQHCPAKAIRLVYEGPVLLPKQPHVTGQGVWVGHWTGTLNH
jgi:hypothetical protein